MINVQLVAANETLDEVVVTTFGTAKKSSFTGSSAKIGAEKLAVRPITNIGQALEGIAPGVTTTSTSGQPGSSPDVRIRGFGSISSSNSPLYVVDGVPFSASIANLNNDDLFKAGIARSGAYNRSLTPFGFQNEDRTYWQAPKLYFEMSPFSYADKIKEPILLIHGEADDNTGTYPINSERLYAAIKGNGGTTRFVFLPYEAHSYRGKENLLHMLWEQNNWLQKFVK